MKARDYKTKDAFIKYLSENKSQRFWQAIRNFANVSVVFIGDLDPDTQEPINLIDTFYIESDERRADGKTTDRKNN